MQDALAKFGLHSAYDHPDYQAAMMEFYRPTSAVFPTGPTVFAHVARYANNKIYDTINGPNEFTTIGNLRSGTGQLTYIRSERPSC